MSYTVDKISDRIWELRCDLIPGCLTNSYVIQADKATYLIDSGLGSATAIEMSKLITAGKPVYLINTHYHWDHIWGNAFFANAMVVCHERCVRNVVANWDAMIQRNGQYIDGQTAGFDVQLSFADRLTLNEELVLFHTPGHTDDSISVFYKPERALFVGDLIGDDDTELLPSVKDPDHFLASLELCASFDPRLYLSGHNDIKYPGILEQIAKLYNEEGA